MSTANETSSVLPTMTYYPMNYPDHPDDIVFLCGAHLFGCNSGILAASCPALMQTFYSQSDGPTELTPVLNGVNPNVLWRMWKYITEIDYDDGPQGDVEPRSTVLASSNISDITNAALFTNAEVYAFAHRYGHSNLESLAAEKFAQRMTEPWDIDVLPDLVDGIFTTTPKENRALRMMICEGAAKRIDEVIGHSKCADVMKDNGDFTYGILLCVLSNDLWEIHNPRAEVGDLETGLEQRRDEQAEESRVEMVGDEEA